MVSIGGVLEAVFKTPPLPDLLAVFGAAAAVGGAIVGAVVGKASTWRRLFEDSSLGATVGGTLVCMVVFLIYLLSKV